MHDTVVLDLDGTLVDSVYEHVLAWQGAFRDVGLEIPAARLHRLIGMGGDRLVTEAAGRVVEESLGDELRARHPQHLDRLFGSITPTQGVAAFLEALHTHELEVVLASSSDADLTRRLLDVVPDEKRVLSTLVTGSDAQKSKPSGELIEVALKSVDADRALVVGDAVWDVKAAADAEVPCIGVLTGGMSEAELTEAGAVRCFATPGDIAEHLERTGSLL